MSQDIFKICEDEYNSLQEEEQISLRNEKAFKIFIQLISTKYDYTMSLRNEIIDQMCADAYHFADAFLKYSSK